MAAFVGCWTVLLSVCGLWHAFVVVAADGERKPVWTWMNGSTQLNQPSILTPGMQYPGCRADSGVWTHPTEGIMWMFGGKDGSRTPLNELWRFDMVTQEWAIIQQRQEQEWPGPRYGAAVCGVASSSILVYGGVDSPNHLLFDTWLYHQHNESWRLLSENVGSDMPGTRLHWCTSNDLWILGGEASKPDLLTMWRFSFMSYEWTKLDTTVGEARSREETLADGTDVGQRQLHVSADLVANESFFYLLEGGVLKPPDMSCDTKQSRAQGSCNVWRFSTISKHWENLSINTSNVLNAGNNMPYNQPSCPAHTAAWLDTSNNLWLLGNKGGARAACEKQTRAPILWMLDLTYMTWRSYEHTSTSMHQLRYGILEGTLPLQRDPPPRAFSASWSWNDAHYLFGGLVKNGTAGALNDLWCFKLTTPANLHRNYPSSLALPPVAVFFLAFGALCLLSLFVFSMIFFSKCLSGPRLKPPNHFGDKIRYSPVDTDEVFIT